MMKIPSRLAMPGMMVVVVLQLMWLPAAAQPLLTDTFDYPDGDLAGQGGWFSYTLGLQTNPVQVVDGRARLVNGISGAQDVSTGLPVRGTTATTYAVYDLTVRSDLGETAFSQLYRLTHFRYDQIFAYPGRVCVGPPQAGGDYSIGIAARSQLLVALWPVDLMFDVSYRILSSYDAAAGTATLWVNPTSAADPSITSSDPGAVGWTVDSYALNQSPTDFAVIDIDNLAVGPTFEDVQEPVNHPPDCSAAHALVEMLWPPDHWMTPVTITGVTDPDGDAVTIVATAIAQDEAVEERGDGTNCPDGRIDGSGRASVRRERSGSGNGRVYTVSFTATDGRGAQCEGEVHVCVPRDSHDSACIDDGSRYDARVPCDRAQVRSEVGEATDLRVLASEGGRVLLQFVLEEDREAVDLAVFDVSGRRMATLASGSWSSGRHQVAWRAEPSSPGVYFARLRTSAGDRTRSIVVRP